MKKQLLIAAVAATMGTAAIADVSITGNGKFEYFNTETSTGSTNKTNTEVNLKITGKNGDTTVVANYEFSNQGDVDGGAASMDIEDIYMTTKIADVTVKAGNYASSTAGILGEIDEGGRATNKVTLSTTIGGVAIYAGNSDHGETAASTGTTTLNGNMFFGASMDVAGYKIQAKRVSATVDAFGISGDVAGFGVRLETKSSDTANSDVTFGQIDKTVGDVALTVAWLDVDNTDSLVGETDSAIFAVENGDKATARDNMQISAKTSIAGNTVTVKSGSIDKGISATADLDYVQVAVSRSLASGATFAATYTDKDDSATTDTQILELDLSVSF